MPKVTYEDVIYDSQEELDFKHWLDEAFSAKLVEGYQKCGKGDDTFLLIDKQYYIANGKTKHLFASVEYTPDYFITGFEDFKEKKVHDINGIATIDVKGGFSRFNDNKQFQIIRKMMYHLFGTYVHKVVPDELFLKTWIPEKCRYTAKQGKIKNKFKDTPTIKEYLKKAKASKI